MSDSVRVTYNGRRTIWCTTEYAVDQVAIFTDYKEPAYGLHCCVLRNHAAVRQWAAVFNARLQRQHVVAVDVRACFEIHCSGRSSARLAFDVAAMFGQHMFWHCGLPVFLRKNESSHGATMEDPRYGLTHQLTVRTSKSKLTAVLARRVHSPLFEIHFERYVYLLKNNQ